MQKRENIKGIAYKYVYIYTYVGVNIFGIQSGSIELGCRRAFFGSAFDFAAAGGSGSVHLRRS
jgi:hypothetical protein